MLSSHTPLSIAANLLASDTIESVLRSPSFHARGWQILDRWAFNSPIQLRQLEAEGEVVLLGRLLEQQQIEHQVLLAPESLAQYRHGLAEQEILALHEISLGL